MTAELERFFEQDASSWSMAKYQESGINFPSGNDPLELSLGLN